MVRLLVACSFAVVGKAAKVKYDASSHIPVRSSGCGSASPYSKGKTTVATAKYDGVTYTYRVYVPTAYDESTPLPLIVQHHGWGMTAESEQRGSGVCDFADSIGYICVVPQGSGDNTHRGGPWYSWNAVGSSLSPGPQGPTCTNSTSNDNYCYTSCGSCSDSPQCWWTTCYNEVTPSGTGYSDVTGYIPSLYDTLESQLCIDTTREYVAGESNGGMMTYQVATDMSHRLAAAVPQFGSFHRGFLQGPTASMPLMDIHGTRDTTVPANVSLSSDGYYYTTTDDIFAVWGSANGCSGTSSHYPTPYDGSNALWCASYGSCSGGDLVRCSWNGGHNWYGNSAAKNGGLVTWFAFQWTETSHRGFGNKQAGDFLDSIEIIDEIEDEASNDFDDLDSTLNAAANAHYGNPTDGCQEDEEAIGLGSGVVCAPKIASRLSGSGVPEPACIIGGEVPSDNGCPTDANISVSSKAFPVCLAKGSSADPYTNGEFHCVLVCPCAIDGESCGDMADEHCPTGSSCQPGELRHRGKGVCTFPAATVV